MSDGIERRDFLKVLGAGSAGASMVGCSTENVEKLIPYLNPPEDVTPGVATWYATTSGDCPCGCGVWVRTREGRAVKLEGNPEHPISRGALCVRGQASIQGLYDPDRFPGPMRRQEDGELEPISWDDAEALLAQRLDGSESLLITGTLGPSMADLAENFVSGVGGVRVEYEALSEAPLREATRIAFGRDVVPTYDLSEARLILSFGADFLGDWLSPVEYGREFSRSSAVDEHGSKGRLVFLAPRLSLTGQNADDWFPIRPGSEAVVALAMAGVIAEGNGAAGPYAPVLEAYDVQAAAEASGLETSDIEELARAFVRQGPSVALGPGLEGQHRNATAANLAVLVLNAVAGNVGSTVQLQTADLDAPSAPFGEMESAISGMEAGDVDVALIHGTNPAYSLPSGAGFADAFGNVPFTVSFASAPDETAALCDLILPDRHYLEAWGDARPRPGVYSVQQPVMQPVPHFDSKQTGDVLLSVASRLGLGLGADTFQEHLRGRWERVHGLAGGERDFEAFWRDTLARGVVEVTAPADEPVALRSPDAALSFDVPAFDGEGDLTLLVHPSPRFGAGEHANRPWLQELPDPVSKITWHSWVEVNPETARRMGLTDGDVVRVRSPHGELEAPVWIYPGVREDVVALAMGGGHENFGRYANGKGVNPMVLLPAEAEQPSGSLVQLATTVTLEPTGERRRLASVAGSDDQDQRPIAPAVALDELEGGGMAMAAGAAHGQEAGAAAAEEHGGGADQEQEHAQEASGHETGGHGGGQRQELQAVGGFVPVPTEGRSRDFPLPGSDKELYSDAEHTPRWGMAIDLDKCTGCSACVTACQAENNVPWVGEEQVLMGREMNWIRIERYYEDVDATRAGPVDVRHLPMLCQHCNNAPCEPVCPVFAAYHTPDGLNAQVYNRCVGTRYCANNCPYKVRVFNWYTYTDVPEPLNWQYNPDVTVRENGVMEKCTFCVQRIRDAQHRATLEGRQVRDGEVVPACQQTCPAEAIVFGDIRDPDSRVAQVVESERTYRVLDEAINTQPAVNYLKKVTFHHVESGEHG